MAKKQNAGTSPWDYFVIAAMMAMGTAAGYVLARGAGQVYQKAVGVVTGNGSAPALSGGVSAASPAVYGGGQNASQYY